MVRRSLPVRRAAPLAGARNRHDPVVKCVSQAIKRVQQQLKQERLETERARREEAIAHRNAEADRWTAEQYAKLRVADNKSIEELLEQERCAVRLTMRPPEPTEELRTWLSASVWNQLLPLRFVRKDTNAGVASPITKQRQGPRAVDVWCTMRKALPTLQHSKRLPRAPVHRVEAEDAAIAARPPRPSRQAVWLPSPLSREAVGPAARKLDGVILTCDHVAERAEAEWAAESRLERSRRQKAHGCKSLLGMTDEVFYKHLRDNVIEAAEARAELERRKRCIHDGKSASYGPPEGVHPQFGLMDEEEEEEAKSAMPPPPATSPTSAAAVAGDDADVYANWVSNPWLNYLQMKAERALCEAAAKWVAA